MFIYDLIVHRDQPIDWIKPVFIFCFILFISSLIKSLGNKYNVQLTNKDRALGGCEWMLVI